MKEDKYDVVMVNVGTEGHIDNAHMALRNHLVERGYRVCITGTGDVGFGDLGNGMVNEMGGAAEAFREFNKEIVLPAAFEPNGYYPKRKRGKGKKYHK